MTSFHRISSKSDSLQAFTRKSLISFGLLCCFLGGLPSTLADPPRISVDGDWKVHVVADDLSGHFDIALPEIVKVSDEQINALPLYNENGPSYRRGALLKGVKADECSVWGALHLGSVVVRDKAEGKGKIFAAGTDYKVDDWGGIGRLEGGGIGEQQPVFVSYQYGMMRIDSVVNKGGKLELRQGKSHVSIPRPVELNAGEKRVANIWITGNANRLTDDEVFAILSDKYPVPKRTGPSVAENLLPKTLKKLQKGEKVHVLAWGDSVTDAGYLPEKDVNRWQEQFVRRLRKAYPDAEIVLTTEAWGGRNTGTYLAEPPGSVHNYKEKVLDVKPDLIVMEFVNDAGLAGEVLFQRYDKLLADFQDIGAEWIILTPHYVRPDWMTLNSCKNCDEDPRPYVHGIRAFGRERGVAVAEGAKRYGHLWRQGIPYLTLMTNNINHPDPYGMSLFADALMELFPVPEDRP